MNDELAFGLLNLRWGHGSDEIESSPLWDRPHHCQLVDVDTNGTVEVVRRDGVWQTAAGFSQVAEYPPMNVGVWGGEASPVVDLDGDCHAERATDVGILDAVTGSLEVPWQLAAHEQLVAFTGAPVRDADGVVVFLGNESNVGAGLHYVERSFALELDGSVRWMIETDDAMAPAIGDVDGDGTPELVVHSNLGITAIRPDGTFAWSVPDRVPQAPSEGANLVLVDFDGDGAFEVVFFGPDTLDVLSGRDGSVLTSTKTVFRVDTVWSAPAVADLDEDGSLELVMFGASEPVGVDEPIWYIYGVSLGAASGRFARGRPYWNQYGYDASAVDADGAVITWPIPMFDATNSFRAQPAFDGDFPDLVPVVAGACSDEDVCNGADGTVLVTAQVENRGSATAMPGAVVRLYTRDGVNACFAEVASATVPEAIPSMTASAGVLLSVPIAAWGTERVLQVVNDADHDCDPVNNRVPVVIDVCGG